MLTCSTGIGGWVLLYFYCSCRPEEGNESKLLIDVFGMKRRISIRPTRNRSQSEGLQICLNCDKSCASSTLLAYRASRIGVAFFVDISQHKA